jgi:glutathionyl-hydroquinone reductase
LKKFAIILCLGFIACSEEVEERPVPVGLISETDIIPIIIDVQLLESHYQRLYSRPDAYKGALDSASNIAFENNGVTRAQFADSYDYYSQDAEGMFYLYEATLDTINQRIADRQQQINPGQEALE